MSDAFTVPACAACGHPLWPPRPVCPRCGGTTFESRAADRGKVEESTRSGDAALASVRTAPGPVVVARLARDAEAGAEVELRWAPAAGGGRRVLATPRL